MTKTDSERLEEKAPKILKKEKSLSDYSNDSSPHITSSEEDFDASKSKK